mmetsp:Transcript_17648/g.27303  ORF Transcript_17648/g.27303 Transcript_17648/m.27303 type:complete len:166 (-) Transcript_17648:685-1182(-)
MGKPRSDRHFWVNLSYTLNSLLVYALVLPSFWSQAQAYLIRFGFMLCSIRQIIYVYDPAGLRAQKDPEDWFIFVMVQLMCSNYALSYHFHYFNNDEPGHLAFSIFYFNLIVFGISASVHGTPSLIENENFMSLSIVCFIMMIAATLLARSESIHSEHIEKIFKHI